MCRELPSVYFPRNPDLTDFVAKSAYISHSIFTTRTTFRDELLIIRYSADEKVYQFVISCEMQVIIEWRISLFSQERNGLIVQKTGQKTSVFFNTFITC